MLSNDIVVNPTDYTLEIENFATPIPTLVDLSLFSDSGRQNNDDLTNDSTPTLLVHVDTQNFVDPDEDGTLFTTILTPAQFAAHTAGVAVEVFTESGSIGIAAAVLERRTFLVSPRHFSSMVSTRSLRLFVSTIPTRFCLRPLRSAIVIRVVGIDRIHF